MSKENRQNTSGEMLEENRVEIREIPGTEGFYNAGALELDGKTYLLGRRVGSAGGDGEPDVSSLELITLNANCEIESCKEVWRPNSQEHLLEDTRILRLQNGKIILGMTFVVHENGSYIPHPAVMELDYIDQIEGGFRLKDIGLLGAIALDNSQKNNTKADSNRPVLEVIRGMRGNQTTPLGEQALDTEGKNVTAIGSNLFVFRPEGEENNHRLLVFERKKNGEVVQKQYIEFPNDISWGQWRVGTTMPPIWINKNEAIFPIHGITIEDGKFVYSIGMSRLTRGKNGELSVDNISQKPVIHPDLFAGHYNEDDVELHKERRVVYCCGGLPVYDDNNELSGLKMYVNVGDKRTVEATVDICDLIEGWQKADSNDPELPVAV